MHLGVDLGSGSVKVILVDRSGSEWESSRTYPIEAPMPGYAETDPRRWLEAIESCLRDLPELNRVRSIGLSGQMHGIVPVSRQTGEATHKAITWADSRGRAYLDRIGKQTALVANALRNAPAAGMAASTLLWLKHEAPETYEKSGIFLFPKDYVRLALTDTLSTEPTDASGSLLYDFRSGDWSRALIEALGLDERKLPAISPSTSVGGYVSREAQERFGLPRGVPVALGAGDTPAAMYAAELLEERVVQVSVGTAAQVSRPVRSLPEYNPGINLFEGVEGGVRYRIAAMLNGGIALEWVRKSLGFDWDRLYGDLEREGTLPSRELHFLPYLTGERTPYMDPEARGAWTGLSLHHSSRDLALAAMVGVAESVRLGLDTLGTEGVELIRLVGGSARYRYWARLLATVLRLPVCVSDGTNGSARGAARIAAAAVGEDLTFSETLTPVEPFDLPWIEEHYREFLELYRKLNGR